MCFGVVSTRILSHTHSFKWHRDKKMFAIMSLENIYDISDLSILNKFTQNASFLASITRYNDDTSFSRKHFSPYSSHSRCLFYIQTHRATHLHPYKSGRVFFTPSILCVHTYAPLATTNYLNCRCVYWTYRCTYPFCVQSYMQVFSKIVNVVEWKRRRIYLIFPSSFHIVFDGYRSRNPYT